MRILKLLIVLAVFWINNVEAQTWQSIHKVGSFETAPTRSFQINPYNNSLWLIQDTKVAVIENNGTILNFDSDDFGTLWPNDNLQFAFTPTDIFYNINLYGFHSFTGYSSTLINASFEDYRNMTSNLDTVYVTMADLSGFRKFYNGTVESFSKNFTEIDAKGIFVYGNNGGSVIYQYIQSTNTTINLTSDPQYLWYVYNDTKFSRNTDTFYVGGTKGISYAYNYDFLDTITPNNTFNMPSPNVLEMEFDAEDSLWAVFGDINNNPFALAKLEGDTWTNIFNASNSPIDFSTFLSFEIDTLGNLWVADFNYLHTLLTPNSPGWLSLLEKEKEINFSIYPNPSNDFITINCKSMIDNIEIVDLQGRKVHSSFYYSFNPIVNIIDLQVGTYFIKVVSGTNVEFQQFVKQ
jgi:hypothetical protein